MTLLQLGRAVAVGRASMSVLRLRAVVLPLAYVALAEIIRALAFDSWHESLPELAFYFGVVAVGAVVFSHFTFRAIEQLTEQRRRHIRQLEGLNRVALLSSSRRPLQEILDEAIGEVLAVVGADAGLVCIIDGERREHTAAAARGFTEAFIKSFVRLPLDHDAIATEVFETGCPVAVVDLLEHPVMGPAARRENVRSSISTPLKFHDSVEGVLAICTRQLREFDDSDREFLLNVATQLALVVTHAEAYDSAVRRADELEALVRVGAAAGSSLDLKDVLCGSMTTLLDVSGVDAGEVWLANGDSLEFAGWPERTPRVGGCEPCLGYGQGLAGRVWEAGAPVVVSDTATEPGGFTSAACDAGFRSCAGLPLLLRSRLVGVLAVASTSHAAFDERQRVRLLEGAAEVLSVAIENARLHERVQEQAVLEERERLARELHDGLAQVLAFVNAQSIAVGKWISAGKPDEAKVDLDRMQGAVRELYADVREAILGLRTPLPAQGGLVGAVRDYLEDFTRMTGIPCELSVPPGDRLPAIDHVREIQAIRIVQEVLSNVRRHAGAERVCVSIAGCDGASVELVIADDGHGFDPEHVLERGWPRFGLRTMRERAESVGGSLAVESERGRGTTVSLVLPAPNTAGSDSVLEPALLAGGGE